jgi:hypothetical protein
MPTSSIVDPGVEVQNTSLNGQKHCSPTHSSSNFAKGCGQNNFDLLKFSNIESVTTTT